MPLLSKSRYRLGLECPAKIFYGNNRQRYPDTKSGNEFLKALAEGGFQVGELARLMFPGDLVKTLDPTFALAKTGQLLGRQRAIVHEAAFQHGQFFIRADILVKNGERVDLIEVKSKSYDEDNSSESILTGKNEVRSSWLHYLHDIAFQTLVVRLCCPDWVVTPHLLLVNKQASAPMDGINSLFLCRRDNDGGVEVSTPSGVPREVLESDLLKKHDVSEAVEKILSNDYDGESFLQRAGRWAQASVAGEKLPVEVGASKCSRCEFRAEPRDRAQGKLSGFHECWRAATGLEDRELDSPLVLDIWNYRRKQELLDQGKFLLRDVDPAQIVETKSPAPTSGWSNSERQRIQIRCVREGNLNRPVVDSGGLRAALSRLMFPLHFIDFETTRCALPFHKGERPYGNVAFQFSHHVVEADGRVRHASQWICLDRGIQPNESFARALQTSLGGDAGSILHFAAHERTVLADIASGLEAGGSSSGLSNWIRSILPAPVGNGPGRMVDLKEILQRHYYHPLARGSNSLKAILPAILSTSPFLKKTYSAPVYGTPAMPSCNFHNTAWITAGGSDPYANLPPMETLESRERFFNDDSIRDGGAAMVAYAKCQFTGISAGEVDAIRSALLKYCELDTLAMVMLWQTWKNDHLD